VDRLKKQTKKASELTKYIDEEGNDIDDDPMFAEQDLMTLQADRIKLLMYEIPNEERIILLLKYQDEMSIKDIARVSELSESAVKMRLKRGREKLLRIYKEKYEHNVI
jgi:RNA polymerase sigma-70 factor (ECF subfamily)